MIWLNWRQFRVQACAGAAALALIAAYMLPLTGDRMYGLAVIEVPVPAQYCVRPYQQPHPPQRAGRRPVQQRREQRPVRRSKPHPLCGKLALQRRHAAVQDLLADSHDLRSIARNLGVARNTVRKFARAASPEELLLATQPADLPCCSLMASIKTSHYRSLNTPASTGAR